MRVRGITASRSQDLDTAPLRPLAVATFPVQGSPKLIASLQKSRCRSSAKYTMTHYTKFRRDALTDKQALKLNSDHYVMGLRRYCERVYKLMNLF